jgi:hypothetical protein
VELNGHSVREARPLQEQLLPRRDHAEGVTFFPGAWTAPSSWDAVTRQATVADLEPNDAAENWLVHPLRLCPGLSPLLIPEGEAVDVHLNGAPTADAIR